jgi:hypothetical protein
LVTWLLSVSLPWRVATVSLATWPRLVLSADQQITGGAVDEDLLTAAPQGGTAEQAAPAQQSA